MNLLRYFYLGCCAAADVMLLVFCFAGVAAFTEDPYLNVPLGMILAVTLCAVILLGITIASFYKVRKGKKYPVLPGFLLKISVIILTLGIIWFILDIPEAGWLAVVVAIPLGALSILLPRLQSNRSAAGKKAPQAIEIKAFQADKAEWAWDDAAAEYLRLQGQNIDTGTEEGQKELAGRIAELAAAESDRIFDYAGTPIAYFLGWLIQRDLTSEEFAAMHTPEEIQAVRDEMRSPVDVFRNMGYVLSQKEIRTFADSIRVR